MRARNMWGLAGVAAVLAVGTGCTGPADSADPPKSAATGSTTGAATTPPAGTASAQPAPTKPAQTKPAASGTAKPAPAEGTPAGGECPVTGAKLVAALYADPSDIKDRLAKTATLSDVECYRGYAVGLTNPKEADRATVVFRYDSTGRAWHPINGGTAGVCDPEVPRTVRTHLDLCH
ncbi:hypothetical protein [Krasilnikovia sp. MM14-A1004]|uniref:hypothetical protein n=1 Tax=Krasilnikovia sp. MM14-A1004 TaxID=3373541 RepID=UPI00399CD4C3